MSRDDFGREIAVSATGDPDSESAEEVWPRAVGDFALDGESLAITDLHGHFLPFVRAVQFIPHGPGPPQRPHIPGADCGDELSFPTAAKTLISRAVCFDPHFGHGGLSSDDIDFTSFSKRDSHFLQVYSYRGIHELYLENRRRATVKRWWHRHSCLCLL